jgi:alpha,alpha-trehalase
MMMRILAVSLLAIFQAASLFPLSTQAQLANKGLEPILHYIASEWDDLTRSMTQCDNVADPKVLDAALLYVPKGIELPSLKALEKTCRVEVQTLPDGIRRPGLLFLPNPYVVPGGRFNEMYEWDSYFIILGLLKDGRVPLARGMVENFFFEIEHYGKVLNANRTYYLTRSQLPFLSSMIMAVYQAQKNAGYEDREWLSRAYHFAELDYALWTQGAHLAGSTGLSRYYDFGDGPAPESLAGEKGHYRKAAGYFLAHPQLAQAYLVPATGDASLGPSYNVRVCDGPDCEDAESVQLTAEYYKGDRSMRESGFDVSFRFEPFGAGTHHFAPVCLNSLLYKTEKDLEAMSRSLGRTADAGKWQGRAEERKKAVTQYLWDEQRGMFFDYNFVTATRSTYEYATTFYPLWTGLATPEQAKAVINNLKIFEGPGGLLTSPYNTGCQWDYTNGWAPLQLIGVEGLRRFGDSAGADRIAYKFLSTVAENFRRKKNIFEKYDVVTRSPEVQVRAGYQENATGFGWTNGVFLALLDELPQNMSQKLAREQDTQ